MSWGLVAIAGVSYIQGEKNRKAGNRAANQAHEISAQNMAMQKEMLEKNLAFKKEEAAKLEAQKEVYRNMEFKNPYTNIENVFEDLTVDMRAIEYQTQQGQQARANILGGLRGAAGTSGIAGLAQSLANQQQLQAQKISIGIGQQERQNQLMAAKMANQIDMTQRGGIASLQEMEMSRQATLLGIQMGQTSGANKAALASEANQMAAGAAQANMYGQQASSLYGLAGEQQSQAFDLLAQTQM